jgi:hypothetical protein
MRAMKENSKKKEITKKSPISHNTILEVDALLSVLLSHYFSEKVLN